MIRRTLTALSRAFFVGAILFPAVAGAQSVFYYRSQTGDPVGGGQTRTIGSPATTFTASGTLPSRATIQMNGANYAYADFQVPAGQTLAIGTYSVPVSAYSGAVQSPLLNVQTYSSCEVTSGTFQVLDIVRNGNGTLTSLAVDFMQRCANRSAVLTGQIRFNSGIPIDNLRRIPDSVSFTTQTGLAPGATALSNTVTLSAMDVPAALSITGGTYSLNGGPFTDAAGSVSAGDYLRIQIVAPNAENRRVAAVLNIGGYTTDFVVTTQTGTRPQPAGDPLVVVQALPQYNGTERLETLGPGTLKVVRLLKATDNTLPGIRVTSEDESSPYWGAWTLNLYTGPTLPAAGTYDDLSGYSGYGTRYLSVYNPTYQMACSYTPTRQRVVIHEVTYAANGTPTQLALDFVQECGAVTYGPSRVRGFVRVNSTVPIDYSNRSPIPFRFPAVKDALLSTLYVSATGAAQGITEDVPISVTGGEYAINDGAYTQAAGTISNGNAVKVRLTSAAAANTLTTATLRMGDVEYPFHVGTAPGSTPQALDGNILLKVGVPADATALSAIVNYTAATLYKLRAVKQYSGAGNNVEAIPLDDPNASYAAYVSAAGPATSRLAVGAWEYAGTGPTPTGYPQISAYIQGTPCNEYSYSFPVPRRYVVHEASYGPDDRLTGLALDMRYQCPFGGVDYVFVRLNSLVPIDHVRTLPSLLSFKEKIDASPGTWVVSDPLVIAGITVPVAVEVTGGEYSIDDSPFVAGAGMISAGQTLRIRVLSPGAADRSISARVRVGSGETTFFVGTRSEPQPQPHDFEPLAVLYRQDRASGALTQYVWSPARLSRMTGSSSTAGVAEIQFSQPEPTPYYSTQWVFRITARTNNTLGPGTYTTTLTDATAAEPGFYSYYPYDQSVLPRCAPYYSYGVTLQVPRRVVFHIREIERSISGELIRLAVDFVETCTAGSDIANYPTAAIAGFIRFNSSVPISHEVRQPVPLRFSPVLRVAPGTVVESELQSLRGFNVALPVSVANGEVSIDGGPYVAQAVNVLPGQTIRVRATASMLSNALTTATVTIGDHLATFQVGTEPGFGATAGGNPLIHLISQGNDPVGLGRTFTLSPALLSTITAARYSNGTIQVDARHAPGETPTEWSFRFAAANLEPLAVGIYGNVTSSFGGSLPYLGVSVSGLGYFCYNISPTSAFNVREIITSGSTVARLAIDFVHYCFGSTDPLYGYIRWNSTIPITPIADADPAPFTIPRQDNAPRVATVVSAEVVIGGFNAPTPISIVGGEYSVGLAAFTSAPGIVSPGQIVRVRLATTADFGTEHVATLKVGNRSATFGVRTEFRDTNPETLEFPSLIDQPRNTAILSEIRVVGGINDAVPVYVSGGEVSIAGASFSGTGGTIQPGQTLRLRLQSSTSHGTTTYMTVQVGERLLGFSVRTGAQGVLVVQPPTNGRVLSVVANIDCPGTCSALVDQGINVELLAVPDAGFGVANWSIPACATASTCSFVADLTNSVSVSFADRRPGAPVILEAVAGDGSASFRLQPGPGAPGLPVTSYSINCNPGAHSLVQSGTWGTLTGLTNGTAYECTARANNAAGFGVLASAQVIVTPQAGAALALISAVSRKTHGVDQIMDLPLQASTQASAAVTIEPRAQGAAHQLVFAFNNPLNGIGLPSATDEAGNPVVVMMMASGPSEVILQLAPLMDGKRVSVSFSALHSNGPLDVFATIGFLLGDVSQSGHVGFADLGMTKLHSGNMTTRDNFLCDINLSGMIGAADVIAVKRRLGRQLQ
ncbi:MAG: fibronectin type III domain-containing protein [Betaproteobacteria bacterium]|nr:fibronectin type III domain-containing protein [Betaproteobacteria bacterium]